MNALVRWDPFRELDNFSNRLASVFDRPGDSQPNGEDRLLTRGQWVPAVDISEDDKEYLITAELPGIEKSDVHIKVENGLLVISGERRSEHEEKKARQHRIERSYGSFARAFSLPEEVESDKIHAAFKNGELALHLPKNEKAKPKNIDIKIT